MKTLYYGDKLKVLAALIFFALFAINASKAAAQVEYIQMHIDGDACVAGENDAGKISTIETQQPMDDLGTIYPEHGLSFFTPRPDKSVWFEVLKLKVDGTGCTLTSADITVIGKLERAGDFFLLTSNTSKQEFFLDARRVMDVVTAPDSAYSTVEVTGIWTTLRERHASREEIDPKIITPKSQATLPR